ncbi:MAG TPA: hypothetical protein VGW39_09470 [Chthoniobacterales bacterium]|nr:hypothetical protein [Chthoniobacterales bacterium]
MKTILQRKQSGSSLVIVLTVLTTLMVVVAVAAEYTMVVNRHVQRSNTEQTAVNVADNCLEIMFSHWRAICSASGTAAVTPQNTQQFASIPLPTATQLNLPNVTVKRGTSRDPANDEYDPNFIVSNYKVVAVNAQWKQLASATATPEPMLGQLAAAVVASNLPTTSLVYNYIASADVTLPALGPAGSRTLVARVQRVFQKQQLSPWNFAIFYADPLEIHPGPQFTVTGWVHTNSDLYTGHNTLTFADKVTYAADWFVDFMPGETSHSGETPTAPNYLADLPPARDQALQPFGLDSTSIFNTTDPNPNNDSYRELIEAPSAASADPLSSARYWNQAGIIIEVSDNPSSTSPGYDGVNGHDLVKFYTVNPATGVTTQISSSSSGASLALYNMFNASGVVTTNQTIQDNREAASIKLTSLDISKLETNATTNTPTWTQSAANFNGIVYAYHKNNTTSTRRGIRLKGGKTIPSTGLTVASANPVYIQGDFNVGPGTVPSNSTLANDPLTPQSSGYTRAPTSILADAVNILSNNWSDSNAQSGDPLSSRMATNTTVNTAVIAGIVPSSPVGGDGTYSGGAENFPRFLEIWGSDNTLTYYGSMIQLWKSAQSIGKWGSANVYDPPKRQWYFDTNFKTKPPPGSLMLYSYIKGKWTLL